MDSWHLYRQAAGPLPARNLVWPFHGAGLQSLGREGAPVVEPLPAPGDDEILVRVDALGICASDGKMVRMGPDYPLFFPRNWENDPIRLGHEAAFTVIDVGATWRDRFHRGQRLGVQANVYQDGRRVIFGVNIPGAMAQYVLLDRRVLDADECYVFPVPETLSYSDIALIEPWACVEAAYLPVRRLSPRPGGVMWLQGGDDETAWTCGGDLAPSRVVVSDAPKALVDWFASLGVEVIDGAGLSPGVLTGRHTGGVGFDDIVLIQPRTAAAVAEALDNLAPQGLLNLVMAAPLDGPVSVDIGRLHYEPLAIVGCQGPDIAAAYGQERNRSDLKPGGVAWIAGAGGAMGRMHLQRALELPHPPRAIIASNRGEGRLNSLVRDLAPLAAAASVEFAPVSPRQDAQRLEREIARLTDGRGCDDIVMVVSDTTLMEQATSLLADDGLMVFYAGVPIGTRVLLPLESTALAGVQFTGTSGSTLADQFALLARIEAGQLHPSRPVAAVGGMKAMAEGIAAVIDGRFPGKVVIYPSLPDLPLLSLDDLAAAVPQVGMHLTAGAGWTAAAEKSLFEAMLPDDDRPPTADH